MSDPYNNPYQAPPQPSYDQGGAPPPPPGYGAYGTQQPPPPGGYAPYPGEGAPAYGAGAPQPQSTVPYGGAYGPPYEGGFQHGQQYGAGVGFNQASGGAYDPAQQQQQLMGYTGPGGYPPAGQPGMEQAGQRGDGYYGEQQAIPPPPVPDYSAHPSSPSNQFPQQGAYHQSPYPADPNGPPPAGAAGAEGERGLGGAIMGGLAGHYAGRKKNHGLLGTIGGAILGSYAQDHLKQGHHGKKH